MFEFAFAFAFAIVMQIVATFGLHAHEKLGNKGRMIVCESR